ncbi:BTAD domain-containing putative transcriptional regulator [Streptomyces sedi]|uniref:Transcriptional regulator n=1 Tax=Streptomyces sedi TaxID=555059 RepID=A0A5C4UZM2_9ACTN|nr:BTAD domain-containing putative transcriptional regulator [Streptomyces sedi]TNM28783.1 transcriptional regulator [Streptomyces sedi]
MEASAGARKLTLGGHKQRAVLGLLLLRANRVVATSELLSALWPEENRPTTARKIVQNAVWGLRALFTGENGDHQGVGPELVTRAPGYVLRVPADQVDLHRFNRRVSEGRAALASGRPEEAARLLSAGLAEWHGPALADLVEAGTDWPELTALSRLRLDVMEDRFEAELRSGHDHAVLGELVALAEEEPLRERLCGQLMLALYRCGRQAQALDVFSRVRRALVEEHGLEPSRELQVLQQNILTHDPSLRPPTRTAPVAPAAPAAPAPAATVPETVREPERVPPRTERRSVAVLLVGADLPEGADPRSSRTLYHAATTVAEYAEEFGGVVAGALGRVSVAVFGLRPDAEDGPAAPEGASADAVRAALALRGPLGVPGASWRAVVSAGEALVRRDPHDPAAPVLVVGRLVDQARLLLAGVPNGEIHLSGEAVEDTAGLVPQRPTDRPHVRAVAEPRATPPPAATGLPDPAGGYEAELGILRSLLTRARHHDAPHLVTVLGERGAGKTELLADFIGGIQDDVVRVVRVRAGGSARWSVCDVLRACCGLGREADLADSALTELVHRVAGRGDTAERLLWRMLRERECPDAEADALDAWCDLLVLLARERPLVLSLDDAHVADDSVLNLVERLASVSRDVPLFLMVGARPAELLRRRPFWGSGLRHSGTLTLERLPDVDSTPEVVRATTRLVRRARGHRGAVCHDG